MGKLVKKEKARNAALETKIASLVDEKKKIKKADKKMKEQLKAFVDRESTTAIQHQMDLKKMEKKIKDMVEEKKKYQQQSRKSKQSISKLSYLEKQWKQKEMNHLDEIQELKLEHRKIVKLKVKQEANRSQQLMDMLSERLEDSNGEIERMRIRIIELRDMLNEKQQQLENMSNSRETNMQTDEEAAALIEDYEKEMITIEKEHKAALQSKEKKLSDTLQQLEISHQNTLQEQKSFYEKKIQKIHLNFNNQITLTKKEFVEEKNQMNFLLDKKLKDQDDE